MDSSSLSKGSLLPFDILESILCRVPTDSLNRFKSVCKRWFNLLKDKRFVYNHLDLVQQHFIHLSETLQIINPETNASFSLPFPDEFRDIWSNNIVMHCDGLLLSITNDDSSKLAVWNPFSNQVRWILKPNMGFLKLNMGFSSHHTYGFGYDSTSRDNYKIMWFRREKFVFEVKPTFEIYEFESNSWRTLYAPLDWVLWHSDKGVSVKGNTYWISKSDHMSNKCIECFDFSTETFKYICPFPYYANEEPFNYVALSPYREDKLSLLHQQPWNIEVWITNNVEDNVVSWIKLFAVSSPNLPVLKTPFERYFIDMNNRINILSYEVDQILHSNGDIYCISKIHIIGKDGFQRKEIIAHRPIGISGYVYLPSLVQVPKSEDISKN